MLIALFFDKQWEWNPHISYLELLINEIIVTYAIQGVIRFLSSCSSIVEANLGFWIVWGRGMFGVVIFCSVSYQRLQLLAYPWIEFWIEKRNLIGNYRNSMAAEQSDWFSLLLVLLDVSLSWGPLFSFSRIRLPSSWHQSALATGNVKYSQSSFIESLSRFID